MLQHYKNLNSLSMFISGSAPNIFHKTLRSAYFRLIVMGVVLANGIITATMNFKHDDNPREFFYEKYYYIEVINVKFIHSSE